MPDAPVFFSVVIPLYNKEATVARAIQSVLNQTVQDFEILVVNDGSTDKGPEIVSKINDPRIRLIDQTNQGVSAARNKGIAEAKYQFIAFLDADDEWLPEFLETIVHLRIKFPVCNVFATKYYFSSSEGIRRQAVVNGLPFGFSEGILDNYFSAASISDPPLWTGAISVEKKAIQDIGGFPLGIASGEDLLTWARLATEHQIAYSIQPCAIHYNPQTIADRPDRLPIIPDLVGNALKELYTHYSASHRDLKKYIGLWHRMRATIFMQAGDRANALREIIIASNFSFNIKLFAFLLIALLPDKFSRRLIISIRKWKR